MTDYDVAHIKSMLCFVLAFSATDDLVAVVFGCIGVVYGWRAWTAFRRDTR